MFCLEKGNPEAKFKAEVITCKISDKIHEGDRPCETYVELVFTKGTILSYILFQNYYTYSITIKQMVPKKSEKGEEGTTKQNIFELAEKKSTDVKWVTVLRNYQLMQNSHFEDDAQNWHIIKADQFSNSRYDSTQLCKLRLYLKQPSPNWTEYSIRNPSCYSYKLIQKLISFDAHYFPKDNKRKSKTGGHDVENGQFTQFKQTIAHNLKKFKTNTLHNKYENTIAPYDEVRKIDLSENLKT